MPEGQKKILVVDDEPDARDFFITVLEDNGYATVSARDGNEALQRLEEGLPDLVTLDITMPEESGIRFYRNLKDDPDLASVPVVVVTAVTGYGGDPDPCDLCPVELPHDVGVEQPGDVPSGTERDSRVGRGDRQAVLRRPE